MADRSMMALLEGIMRRLIRLERNQIKPQSSRGLRGATGTVGFTFGANAPKGAVLLNGQAISRTTYRRLFAEIGTVGGPGNGTTTFNVPDAKGCVFAHLGGGVFTVLGARVGSETHTLTVAQMPSHNHGGSTGSSVVPGSRGATVSTSARIPLGGGATTAEDLAGSNHTHTITSQGGGAAHNIVQPTIVTNAFIWT